METATLLHGFAYGEHIEGGRSLGYRLLSPAEPGPWSEEVETLAHRLQAAPYPDGWPVTELFCSALLADGWRVVAAAPMAWWITRRAGVAVESSWWESSRRAGWACRRRCALYRWLKQRRAEADDLRTLGGYFDLAEALTQVPPQRLRRRALVAAERGDGARGSPTLRRRPAYRSGSPFRTSAGRITPVPGSGWHSWATISRSPSMPRTGLSSPGRRESLGFGPTCRVDLLVRHRVSGGIHGPPRHGRPGGPPYGTCRIVHVDLDRIRAGSRRQSPSGGVAARRNPSAWSDVRRSRLRANGGGLLPGRSRSGRRGTTPTSSLSRRSSRATA